MPESEPGTRQRWHDLDALRGFAMILGIVLHAALAFVPSFWIVQDRTAGFASPYDEVLHFIHGFRMPLFFLLSGFFSAMLWRRRGLGSFLRQRTKRIVAPFAICLVTLVPLMTWGARWVSASQFDDLLIAVFYQNTPAVERLLDEGADPDGLRNEDGGTPLHIAALVDNPDVARLLLEAGADPEAVDANGDTALGWAYYVGSTDVADLLVEHGHADWRPPGTDWEDLDTWGFGADEVEELLNLDPWSDNLFHLWFLWFLILYTLGFAVIAFLIDLRERKRGPPIERRGRWARRLMWALIPLTLIPQLAMGGGGALRTFGPDTSAAFAVVPHVLVYYAVFFAFGVIIYGQKAKAGGPLVESFGSRWTIGLPLAVVVVFPITLAITFEPASPWLLASIGQVAFVWLMIAGLMGLFRTLLARERRGVRYLSDSAYWLYLAHLPLVILAQAWIRDWGLPSGVKFVLLVGGVTGVLLLSYQLFVRYTPIGTLLNGKRTRTPSRVRTSVGTRGNPES